MGAGDAEMGAGNDAVGKDKDEAEADEAEDEAELRDASRRALRALSPLSPPPPPPPPPVVLDAIVVLCFQTSEADVFRFLQMRKKWRLREERFKKCLP